MPSAGGGAPVILRGGALQLIGSTGAPGPLADDGVQTGCTVTSSSLFNLPSSLVLGANPGWGSAITYGPMIDIAGWGLAAFLLFKAMK